MAQAARNAAREAFLQRAGWGAAGLAALPADASFRRYFRVRDGTRTALLMDAPPGRENAGAYVRIARHLLSLGLRAPRIHRADQAAGLVLIEDFGDDTYTRLLAGGADETALYALAVDTLLELQRHPAAATLPLPPYDLQRLLDEALLLVDWYYPALRGRPPAPAAREAYAQCWRSAIGELPPLPDTLVLRDYHVDNLMRAADEQGRAQCALLDFQDALLGSPAYDLMSLLEDARRDVPAALVEAMLQRYHAGAGTADRAAFAAHYTVLAAQRHCKVAGIFVRLCRRDGKGTYLAHIPRVLRLLQRTLSAPRLAALRDWLDQHLPDRDLQAAPRIECAHHDT